MRKESAPYRVPPNPGYVGGYNWRAMLTGFALLFLSNIAGTQFIAYRFLYQPALGDALFRAKAFALYQPFAWSIWVLRYMNAKNPDVRLPVQIGLLTVVGGCAATIGVFFIINMRRTKRLSANTEDVHGSARWASEQDVLRTGLLDAGNGVYVGGWYDARKGHLRYLRHDGPEHILAFAPTRSGKGVGLVIPTLLTWSESTVVYDIKGENWAKTAGFRSQQGHLCFKFSPVEEGNSSRFNPLAELRLFTARDVSDAQNVADMIVRTGEDSPQERYWQDAAASITTGMILHVCYAATAEGRTASLADLGRVFTRPGTNFRETLNEIMSYPHDPDYAHGWHTAEDERCMTHPVVREKVQEMLDKEDKDFSGVLSTAKTALTLYSDPLVAKNTSASDFTIQDLVNHDRPVSLYLVVPPADKIRLRPLIRLIFTMIVNRLTEKMDFQGAMQKKNKHRLLFLIDEFPSGTRVANARLGQSYSYDTKECPKTHTNWFSLSFYGEMATVALRLEKGDKVNVVGTMEQREFTPKAGSTRKVYEVVVKQCRLVGRPRTSAQIAKDTGTPEEGPIEPSDSSEAPVPSQEQPDAWAIL